MAVAKLNRGIEDPVAGGFYTVHEAARLLNISQVRRITNWLRGPSVRTPEPVIERQYNPIDRVQELGFFDLLEVRFIDHFRRMGISLQSLRKAAATAREELNQTHPFATSNVKFLTDRKHVFLQVARDLHDVKLLNLVTKQFEIYAALEDVLGRNISFDPSGLAERWKPDPKKYPSIVLDPRYAYGHPIIEESLVPTEALFSLWKAEDGSMKAVADWFEVDEGVVREAIEYEIELLN